MNDRLVVISGPSGSGKSTITRRLIEQVDIQFSVSATTRDPRPGETHAAHYLFVSNDDFQAMIDSGELLEWAIYNGNCYGTPAAPVESANARGRDVLLDIEIQGARQVKAHRPDALLIFIAPPSLEEMESRLRLRGDTSDEDIAERLNIARTQLEEAPDLFDHIVVNKDLDVAVSEVVKLVTDR